MPVKKTKPTDAEQVQNYMNKLDHPLKEGIQLLRNIIKNTDARINERVKWNAPSYYYLQDFLTFGPRKADKILLVVHHPAVVKLQSELLEGDFKDRRLMWFKSIDEINNNKPELERIIKAIIADIEK